MKDKKYDQAYSRLSEDFRASTSKTEFISFLEKSALLDFKEVSWSKRSISGSKGDLEGAITTVSGGSVPLKLSLIWEGDEWRVYSLRKQQAGLVSSDADAVPSNNEQVAIVQESIRHFSASVNAKEFSGFHKHISNLWQRQVTPEKLNEFFKEFIDNEINLSALEKYSPIFTSAPVLDKNGILRVNGIYKTSPSQVHFKFSYIREGISWGLIGTEINLVPVAKQ